MHLVTVKSAAILFPDPGKLYGSGRIRIGNPGSLTDQPCSLIYTAGEQVLPFAVHPGGGVGGARGSRHWGALSGLCHA